MSRAGEALVVRAAGLSTRLLGATGRSAVLAAPDLAALARELAARGYLSGEPRPDAAALEMGIRRGASARLRQLARWDPDATLAPLLFGGEDQRSLRALLRGAHAALPAEVRLAGLIPTPILPERVLAELARQPTVAAIATLLALWGSPYAEPLAPARSGPVELLKLEVTLARFITARALVAARRQGGGWSEFVQESIDGQNLETALTLAGRGDELEPEQHFLAGGARIDLEQFRRLARAGGRELAVPLAARLWAGTPLEAAIRRSGEDPLELARAVDGYRRQHWRREARGAPLGAAPVIHYLLTLQADVRLLQRAAWGLALGAPPSRRQAATEAPR